MVDEINLTAPLRPVLRRATPEDEITREKNKERQEETGSQLTYWLLLTVNHIAAAMMTSMGAFLTAMLLRCV